MSATLQTRLANNALRCPGLIPTQTSGAGTAPLVCNCCVLAIFAANLRKFRCQKTQDKGTQKYDETYPDGQPGL